LVQAGWDGASAAQGVKANSRRIRGMRARFQE
jgi:hypothetical protein